MVTKLFDELGPRYKARPGGYTAHPEVSASASGDNAPMALVELVDRPDAVEDEGDTKKKSSKKKEAAAA